MRLTRKELNEKYGINKNTWNRRHDELIEFLNEFMDIYEYKEGKTYYYEVSDDLPEKIPKMPRKSDRLQKEADYTDYVLAALGPEWKPNSKTKVASEAIKDFAGERYGHYSEKSVVKHYVGKIMDDKGEHSVKMVWVHYPDYIPLDKDELDFLHDCFNKTDLSAEEMQNAFIKYADGESIEDEVDSYNKAMGIFKGKYGYRPIHVYEWRAKVVEGK